MIILVVQLLSYFCTVFSAKKLEGNLPLSEIPFEQTKKRKREYDPTPGLSPADPTKFFEKLAEVSPSCLLLRYAKTHEPSRDSAGETDPVLVEPKSRCSPQPCIADSEDLLSERSQRFIQEAFDVVQPLSLDDRAAILESTMGQAENENWHVERIGRLTASFFKRLLRCRKPEGIVKDIIYPRQVNTEAMRYGRYNEDNAVKANEQIMTCRDRHVTCAYTGLHVHPQYPFIAASPDRMVFEGGDTGLSEVKCPFSFKGKDFLEAAASVKCCLKISGDNVELKKNHAYYYKVQGMMGVTGLKWCDFVVWTNAESVATSTHVERISFDEVLWSSEILPGLLHFYKQCIIPEQLTLRVSRGLPLHNEKEYVAHKKCIA
ncbi:uncharacterized protein LOC119377900 [Rhipicephalus sanguineus]|uniref:uncharacterized protein LOC119377900 n=1 Tax=Rhipicephalus sanguineus TaxID=34632 RepID=UPI001893D895|nr:uncharacterized protein LOC119377900 [Rhipicephalus sanguineus]